MNDPIISPWLIYLISISDKIIIVFSIIAIALGVGLASFYFATWMQGDWEENVKDKIKVHIKLWITIFISGFLALTIPDSKTIISLVVASKITPNTVNSAVQTGKEFKNEIKKDIMDIIDAIQKKEEVNKNGK